MKEKFSRLYSPRVIEIFFILFPVVEVFTSILKRNFDVRFSPGIIYKAIFVIYSLLYLTIVNKKNKKLLSIVVLTIFVFCVINVCVVGISFASIGDVSNLLTFILSTMFFYSYMSNGNKIKIESLIYCVLIYCALVKVAEMTGTQVATYRGDLSLGTKGWYYSGNELSAILSIFLPITIYYTAYTLSLKGFITLLLQVHTMLSIGTKTSLIVPILVILSYGVLSIINWLVNKSQLSKKIICILVVLSAFIICILPNTASYKFFVVRIKENTQSTIKDNNNDDDSDWDDSIINNLDNFILNGRSDFLRAQKDLYSNTTILEKLFGTKYENRLGYDNNNQIKTIEIDLYDIIIKFGMFGMILLYFPIVLFIVCYLSQKIRAKEYTRNDKNTVIFVSSIVAVAISCIAGHVMTSSTIVIFVAYLVGELSNISELNKGKLNEG